MDKRAFTKAESRAAWGRKSAERLETSLDLDAVLERWRGQLRSISTKSGKKKERGKDQEIDVRLSDDVGNYVCGFVFYATLAEMAKRNDGKGTALFLHVPPLETDMDLEKGKAVVIGLVQALAMVWKMQH